MSGLASPFSDAHPHYTPKWLSEKVAEHIPLDFRGRVIDPACGSGNLLVAAALWTNAARRCSDDLEFIGSDVSVRAVRSCERVLANLLPAGNFRIQRTDFLGTSAIDPSEVPSVVVMNPPFCGYGELHSRIRKQVAHRLGLKGRFNLSHAFVRRAVEIFHPRVLVSLLPSNWIYSRASAFRDELDRLGGGWEWEDVGASAFRRVNTHVGILVWRPDGRDSSSSNPRPHSKLLTQIGIEVKQGVATGRDAAFEEIASLNLPIGRNVYAAKGRDIGRTSGSMVWVPPMTFDVRFKRRFVDSVPSRLAKELRNRTCVVNGRRELFEYHEAMPAWFTGAPKLLVPEIVCGALRVELDAGGTRLPLHSAIAIRVPSIELGLALQRHLQSKDERESLVSKAPKLNGGAVRMQVASLRESIIRWALEARLLPTT